MKKILLINSNTEKIPYPVPPTGICLLASILENKYEIEIFDGMFENPDKLIPFINKFKPDYVGLSIRNIDNMQIDNSINFLDKIYDLFIKPINQNINVPFILGGSGFSIYPEYIIKAFNADYGIVGEGEKSFPALLECLDNNINPEGIPGVISSNNLKYTMPENTSGILNIPFSLLDKRLNFDQYKDQSVYSIQTKRGCYHKCVYCVYPCIEGNQYRTRSAKNIADEIEDAYNRLGQITFEFVDSTFNDPPGHAEQICEEIAKRNIKIKLRTMGINPVNVTKKLFDLMLKAGFSQIECTPDSASPSMIKTLQKNFTLEQLIKSAELIKEYDMPTMWFFIFGGPGENEKTLAESFEFIDKHVNKYDMVHMTIGMRIIPNTPLHEISIKEGIVNINDNLIEPVYYISKELGYDKLKKIIKDVSIKNPNCIPASESKPTPEMINAGIKIRNKFNLQEPMFRTLLRLRYQIFERMKVI